MAVFVTIFRPLTCAFVQMVVFVHNVYLNLVSILEFAFLCQFSIQINVIQL